jgi:alkylation response protein AidB-like acyl-CoA dehydrogenase
MDFEFTEEQNLLAEAVQKFMTGRYGTEQRRAILKAPGAFNRDVWNSLAEIGALGLLVPEAQGGFGGGPVEAMLAQNAFGAGMLLEPYWPSAIVATMLLRKLGGDNATKLLAAMPAGEAIVVVAHGELGARYDRDRVQTIARKAGDGWALSGAKAVVVGAGVADTLLVTARHEGASDGFSVFAVARAAEGVRVREFRTIDGRAAADVTLENVRVGRDALLGAEGGARGPLDDALDVALAALCADAIGSMKSLLEATTKYLQTREQFGQPIGKFQALQHRMADMLVHFEQAKSMAYLAAMQCESADVVTRKKALAAAKVIIGQAGRFIAQQAVQLHGGMGMADELDVSHQFRRLTAMELTLGDTDHHLAAFVAAGKA